MNQISCNICPRNCGADRTRTAGFCGGGSQVKLARAALHHWEEPCISGSRGSGTVFFSGCSLQCVYCQNYKISAENFGREVSTGRLGEIFMMLQEQGAHNINLVNPTHYVPWILEALKSVQGELTIPVVYNSGGYDQVETLKTLEGYVQIYLPDLKYYSSEKSARYSNAPDYFQVASQAVQEMFRQTGPVQLDADGIMQRGLMVRHLVLPGSRQDSMKLLDWLSQNLPTGQYYISLMSQYTPFYHSGQFPEINRRISTFEYRQVADHLIDLGLTDGFMQEKSSAKEEYTPDFDLTGI